MADEIRLRAPSVEQDIKVNVVGLEDITKLYKGLNKVTKSLKGLSEVKLDNINNFKLNDSLQNITKLADAVKVLRDAEESLNKTRKNAVGNSSSGTSVIAPKVDVSQFRNAKTVINDYFKLLKKVSSNADISKSHGVYTSQSGEYIKLATEMNVVSAAFEKLKNSMSSMPQTQQAELMGLITKKTRDFAISQEEAAQKAKHANDSMKAGTVEHASAVDALSKKLAQAEDTLRKFSAAETSTKSSSQLAYKTIQSCKSEYEALDAQLKNGSISYDTYKNKIAEINAKMSASVSVIKQNGDAHQKMGEKVKAAVEKFSQWLSVSTMVMLAVRNVKKMVTAVIELDTAMTELRKVTNETEETYSRFLNNAATRAKRTGATLADTVNATADFARLGYSLEEAEKLSDAAVIYKNVGDGIADINEASQSIISTMKAFNIEAGNAMFIVDKFNEVGNNFAISSKGIGDALLRSASAMAAANNTLDETIALITAANTIAQNPDSVGTTMKTVSMYLRAAKTEAEDAGESTEGMAESVSKLRDELLALTGGKVDIQIDEDTFKSTYQIMKELSQVWNELTDISQANILEKIGGKRNANVVAGIIENFEVAEQAMQSAQSAAGSAIAENEKVLSSIQGHIDKFKAVFEDFSRRLISSDLVKFIISVGTAILQVCDALQKVHVLLPTITASILTLNLVKRIKEAKEMAARIVATSSSLLKEKKMTDELALSCSKLSLIEKKKLVTEIESAVASGKLTTEEGKQIIAALGLASADGTLAVANKGLAASFKSVMASIPVVGWIALGATAILEVANAISASKQKADEAKKSLDDYENELKELSDSVNTIANNYRNLKTSSEEVIPRFAQLAKGVNDFGENVSLTDAEYKEFLELNNKIAEMFPELNLGMDSNGNAMLALSYNADTLSESLYNLADAQRQVANQDIAKKMPDVLKSIKSIDEEYESKIKDVKEQQEWLQQTYNDILKGDLSKYGYHWFDWSKDLNANKYKWGQEELEKTLPYKLGLNGVANETLYEGYEGTNVKFNWGFANADMDKIKANFDNMMAGYDTMIENYQNRINAKWKELNPIIGAWLQTDSMFNDINSEMQRVAEKMVSGLDFDSLGLKTEDDIKEYIQDHIISPLFDSSDEVKTAFSKITDWQKELQDGTMSTEEFSDKVKDAFNGIIESLPDDEVQTFKNIFVGAYGEMYETGNDFDSVLGRLVNSWAKSGSVISSTTASLTDLSNAAQDTKARFELLSKAQSDMADGNGLSPDTIKALSSETANYLDYLYEENGIIKLNTDAWEEYCNAPIGDSIEALKQKIEMLREQNTELQNTGGIYSEIGRLNEHMARGLISEEEGNAKIALYTERLQNNADAIARNNDEIDEANSKLQIYEAVWDQVIGKTDAYSQALQNFSTIHSFINQISDSLTTVADLQQTVANGFTLSLDKALEFASVYPEILNSATVSADGQIALNEGVVNAFIAGKHAEFQASIDAKIQELEGDKAALVAKMTFAQAQLDIAKSVGDGEGQITYDVAKYRMETAQTLVDALIAAGVDESEAYKSVAEAMANNTFEFDKIAAEVCKDVDGNFGKAAMSAATNIYNNMSNSAKSVEGFMRVVHQAANAIKAFVKGDVAGAFGTFSGAGGSSNGGISTSASAGNFKGADPTKTSAAAQLQEMINDLEVDISSYQNAISQIDGQITALKALRDTPLSNFSSNNKSGGSGSGSGGRGSGSGSGSDSNSSEKEESWFEKEYKLHKHLLAMDAEEVSDYLTWLNDAYKRAYDEQIITLDDYRKYCEEVYSGLQSLFKDYLNDVEHEISMRENYEGESKKIVELYKTLISKVENEIASARVHGLDDDDDYIQELQKKWQTYTKYIKDLENKLTDSAKSALDKLVDYRINMIKKDVDAEKDALKKKLDALKKFYDKQKDMLKEQKDEEQYLEDQAEKRKSVTDIQEQLAQLANDNSAWAQKRKLELQKELVDAQKSLTDFEKDHAYDLATSALDKAYEAQEDEINKQMDALENMLNDPEALYNQALADIRDNSKNQLYYQMLMYNKRYGDGKDETVIKLWEETYGALDKYEQYFGKLLDGVKLENATGVEKDKSSWDTEKISGTGHTTGTAAPTTSGGGKTSPTSNKKDTTGGSETKSPASSSAPSLANGSTITVKKTATNFSSKSKNVKMASFVPGGQYTVYKTDGNEVLIGRNGVYTGWIKKTDIVGYASGTRNATAGLHAIDERGAETLFTSSDGTKYRMFSSGEKVLNAKASNFLYDFANSGGEILEKIIKSVFGGGSLDKIAPAINNTEVNMGNIIVQGNANERTVSEIRRVQREEVSRMLKEFGKLQK